jgi:hypothetical protein
MARREELPRASRQRRNRRCTKILGNEDELRGERFRER